MYKVLIVEDEMLVRVGLKNSVDWAKFDMEVADDVADGVAALAVYHKEKPDLIITDLKMPKMSGMELIEKIREEDKRVKIIILSCLEEFELARKAMLYGVTEYILKLTMTNKDIERILEKVRTELDADTESRVLDNIVDKSSAYGSDAGREGILKDFLFYGLHSNEHFQAFVTKSQMKISPEGLLLVVLEIDQPGTLVSLLKDEKGHLIQRTILNVLKEILDNRGSGEAFSESSDRYILVMNFKGISSESAQRKEIAAVLSKIRDSMKVYFNVDTSIGASSIRNGYSNLREMYIQAGEALERKFFLGNGVFFHRECRPAGEIILDKLPLMLNLPEFCGIIDESFIDAYKEKVHAVFAAITDDRQQVKELFCDFICWIAEKVHILHADTADNIIDTCMHIKNSGSFNEISGIVRDFFEYIREVHNNKKSYSREIGAALLFIESNYSRDISLAEIAAHVNLSSGYFSGIFKKELGMGFVEYLNNHRIEKAKELLVNTCLKSYEISGQVGFGDETYFSRVFRKNTGMSVLEYRKKWSPERRE